MTEQERQNKNIDVRVKEERINENLTTYRNEKIGIEFDYPKEWGKISESIEEGCFYDPMKIVDKNQDGYQDRMTHLFTEDDKCENIYISAENESQSRTLISIKSNLFKKYPNARGPDWGDYAVENSDLFCHLGKLGKYGFINGECEKFETENGIEVTTKAFDVNAGFSDEKMLMNIFYFKSPNPVYSTVLMSDDSFSRKGDTNGIQKFRKVIESVRFIE